MLFRDFGLCESVLRAVTDEGYETPTPVQAEAIPHILAGRDVLASAQTGTGKTAAFALPILHRLSLEQATPQRRPAPIRCLLLAPTRELALQIQDSLRCYGRHLRLRSAVVMGGVGQEPQVRALQRGVEILVATPGRLMDLIQQGFVKLDAVETLVVDEADRMLDMGFLPDLRRIVQKLPVERQTVMFSATFPPPIAELANSVLRDPVRVRIATTTTNTPKIEQAVCFVPQEHKTTLLASLLQSEAIGRVIVFTRTKRGADRVAEQLNRAGIRADAIHGNKSQGARRRILESFKSKRPPILVATDLAARGIDVDDVSHVFNFDLPDEPETYVHRIGRTGRAGATGKAMAFCGGDERHRLMAIERLLRCKLFEYRDEAISALPRAAKQAAPARRAPQQQQPRRDSGRSAPPVAVQQRPKRSARRALSL